MRLPYVRFPYCPDWCAGRHEAVEEEIGEAAHWSATLTSEVPGVNVQLARFDDIEKDRVKLGRVYGALQVKEGAIGPDSSAVDIESAADMRAIAEALIAAAEIAEGQDER